MNERIDAEKQIHQTDKAAIYEGGSVDYSVIEGPSEKNPIMIVPGFTGGRVALKSFADELSGESGRRIILPDQPILNKHKMPIKDHHAEALLAILYAEDLADRPVDFIATSFGAMIAVRAAELAKAKGVRSFESNKGSHSVFIAPAGSNDRENIFFLGGRWVKFVSKDTINRGELDPTGEMAKAGSKNFWSHPVKTAKEVLELKKKEKMYAQLGSFGLKPFVLGYAGDTMFPHKTLKKVAEDSGEMLSGYAMPIDNDAVGAGSYEEFKIKTGLKGKAARKAWTHHYRNADHADLQYHPARTVKAVLQFLDR